MCELRLPLGRDNNGKPVLVPVKAQDLPAALEGVAQSARTRSFTRTGPRPSQLGTGERRTGVRSGPWLTRPDDPQARDTDSPALLDNRAVAALLSCSVRHVERQRDAGKMPPPVRLGRLVRWRRTALDDWVERGCPRCR